MFVNGILFSKTLFTLPNIRILHVPATLPIAMPYVYLPTDRITCCVYTENQILIFLSVLSISNKFVTYLITSWKVTSSPLCNLSNS